VTRGAPVEPPADPVLPPAVRRALGTLAHAGHEAVVVGGALRDLCLGRPVADWDVATSARPEAVLALFPRAVPIGLRHGTVMVPTAAGPIDVTTWPAGGLAADLGRRDFTINAMALAVPAGAAGGAARWIDPEGGLADLRAGRLRAVGDAGARLDEDPLRALRALRLAAELGLAVDPALAQAIRARAGALRRVAHERVRAELERLLLAPGAAQAVAALRDLGLEAVLVGPVAADAPAVVGALPPDLTLRLAGWLRGRDAAALLARLRFARARGEAVAQLVRLHPIDRVAEPGELGRLLVRIERAGVEALLVLREAELAAGSEGPRETAAVRERLGALRVALERLERAGVLPDGRPRLSVGGREVMEWLGTGPGPRVGRALRFLTERVLEDPSINRPAALRELLDDWASAAQGESRAGR
jgi:tRNA nucleotidyltransferase/poly(A) polymerase